MSSPYSSPYRSRSSLDSSKSLVEIKAEIEELVKIVVPDEQENIDEMLLQFRGREDELLKTLQTMREKEMGEEEAYSHLGRSSNSKLSVFENDLENGSYERLRSGSITDNSSNTNTEDNGDMNRDAAYVGDVVVDTNPQKMQICSECGTHKPKSDFSEAQLKIPISAQCRECEELSALG